MPASSIAVRPVGTGTGYPRDAGEPWVAAATMSMIRFRSQMLAAGNRAPRRVSDAVAAA